MEQLSIMFLTKIGRTFKNPRFVKRTIFDYRTDPYRVGLYNVYKRRSLSVVLYVTFIVYVAIAFVEDPAVEEIGEFPEWWLLSK